MNEPFSRLEALRQQLYRSVEASSGRLDVDAVLSSSQALDEAINAVMKQSETSEPPHQE